MEDSKDEVVKEDPFFSKFAPWLKEHQTGQPLGLDSLFRNVIYPRAFSVVIDALPTTVKNTYLLSLLNVCATHTLCISLRKINDPTPNPKNKKHSPPNSILTFKNEEHLSTTEGRAFEEYTNNHWANLRSYCSQTIAHNIVCHPMTWEIIDKHIAVLARTTAAICEAEGNHPPNLMDFKTLTPKATSIFNEHYAEAEKAWNQYINKVGHWYVTPLTELVELLPDH